MRKLAGIVIAIVVIVVILIFALPAIINVNQYHDRVQSELEQKLGRKVTLGDMSLKVIPFSIQVSNAVIGEDPRFHTGRPFASTQQLAVSAKLLPLLRHELKVNSVELVKPEIELVKNQQGIWNFSSLGNPQPATAPASPNAKNAPATPSSKPSPAAKPSSSESKQESSKSQGEQLSLGELKITDGQVALTDEQKRQARSVYDNIDLDLSNYAPGQPFNLSLTAHLPGQGNQSVAFDGKAGPINQQDTTNTPLDGRLKLNNVSLSGVQKFLNSPQLAGNEAIATGDASVRNANGEMSSAGTIDLNNVKIHGVDIGYPIKANYDVSDNLNSDVIKISKGDIKLGPTPISITGEVNSKPNPAQLNVHLTASDASITQLAKLAGAFGVAFNPGTQVAGTLNADLTARGSASQPAMNGTLNAKDLQISGKDLPQAVKVNSIDLSLTPDMVKSNTFTAQSGSTSLQANFAMSHYTAPNSAIDATIKTANANLGELLNIAKAYGVSAVEGMSGSGSLSLDARVQGPMKQPDKMIYTGTGAIKDATLNMPTLTKPLLIHNANLRFAQNSAVLDNLQASLGSTNASGQATVRNFAAPQLQFALNADKLNITELQQITKSSTPAKKAENEGFSIIPSANAQGRGEPSAISHFAGSGTLSVGSIIFDQLVLNTFKSNLSFSGAPSDNLLRTLNGDINFNTGNGKLQGTDLLHELGAIGKFLQPGQASQGFTNIVKMGGLINVRNGIASTNNLEALIDGGSLGANGTVDLVTEALNMRVNAVLGKGLSQKVGGTGIGGFMNTALANNQGELVIPVIVTGTMAHPAFAPDLEKIAQMKLNHLLPTSGNPGQLTGGILGGLLGGKGGQQQGGVQGILGALTGKQQPANGQQQQQQQNQNPVNDLLGAFGKKKPKQK